MPAGHAAWATACRPGPTISGTVEVDLAGGARRWWPSGRSRLRVRRPAGGRRCLVELTGAGHEGHLEPWDAFWVMRYAVVHDPDGTPVDLFASLASD